MVRDGATKSFVKTQLLSRSARTNQSALDRFGDSVQDVMAAIGAPSKVFPFKLSFEISFESNVSGFLQIGGQDEDPLPKRPQKICCSSLRLFLQLLHHGHGEMSLQSSILIFSTLMLQDILFDAKNNKVKKFILHTNFPGHYNFNM